jgi:hypothetical protein
MSELIKIAARLARREGLPDGTASIVYDWLGAEAVALRKVHTDHIAALEAVKATVKPLEWEEPSASTNQCWTAKSPFGTYSVVNEDGWYAAREPEGFWEWNGDRIIDTRHTAFTACQADYERRILSTIVPSPALEANPMSFTSDDDATEFLKLYGHEETRNGVISGDWRSFDADCRAAVQYLCDEWDFVFEDAALEANQQDVEQKRRESENEAFHVWWQESGHAADPVFTLTTENCAHAAWQARAAQEANQSTPEVLADHERGCQGREYTCTCGYDEANKQVIETLKAEHRAQMADMSERFREVNVSEALRQMGNDKQVIETLRAALTAIEDAILASEDGHFVGDVLANYRAVRRDIQDRRAALSI